MASEGQNDKVKFKNIFEYFSLTIIWKKFPSLDICLLICYSFDKMNVLPELLSAYYQVEIWKRKGSISVILHKNKRFFKLNRYVNSCKPKSSPIFVSINCCWPRFPTCPPPYLWIVYLGNVVKQAPFRTQFSAMVKPYMWNMGSRLNKF